MRNRIGFIAEDNSDVEVLFMLARKVVPGATIEKRSFVAHGSGKIKSKCKSWAMTLAAQQCNMLVVAHDLDRNNINTLRSSLQASLSPSPIGKNLIVIPVHEIEAWLLSDEIAIKKAFQITSKVPKVEAPESISSPKERLGWYVHTHTGKRKRYINAVHNAKIAKYLDIRRVRRCSSFIPLHDFYSSNIH